MNELSSWSQIDWHLIAGGLGLFLFGVKLMGDSLTKFGIILKNIHPIP